MRELSIGESHAHLCSESRRVEREASDSVSQTQHLLIEPVASSTPHYRRPPATPQNLRVVQNDQGPLGVVRALLLVVAAMAELT